MANAEQDDVNIAEMLKEFSELDRAVQGFEDKKEMKLLYHKNVTWLDNEITQSKRDRNACLNRIRAMNVVPLSSLSEVKSLVRARQITLAARRPAIQWNVIATVAPGLDPVPAAAVSGAIVDANIEHDLNVQEGGEAAEAGLEMV